MTETQRTFICVEIPSEHQERIAGLQRRFPSNMRCLRWVKPELLHVTMRFLGNLTSDEVDAAISAARSAAHASRTVHLAVGGLGAFPSNRRPKTIWTAVNQGADELISLSTALDASLSRAEFVLDNDARFRPHITLGRVRPGAARDEIRNISEVLGSRRTGPDTVARFEVGALTVMASVLGHDEPTYRPLAVLSFSPEE